MYEPSFIDSSLYSSRGRDSSLQYSLSSGATSSEPRITPSEYRAAVFARFMPVDSPRSGMSASVMSPNFTSDPRFSSHCHGVSPYRDSTILLDAKIGSSL